MPQHFPAPTRLTVLAAGSSLLLAGLAGCGGAQAASTAADRPISAVTLHVGDQKAGSQALLEAAGQLTAVPYKITWSQFASGPPLLEAINAGAIDIGAVGDTPPIFAAAASSSITIVGASHTDPVGSAILVPQSSTVTSIVGLRGKKVAVAKGSSANYHLLAVLANAGLTFRDITPVYLAPSDGLSAFTGGSIDAWAIWDPYTALAQQQVHARVLATGVGLIGGDGFQVASPAAVKDHAEAAAIKDYLTRLARARTWATSHRAAWSATWAKATGLPLAVATVAVARGGATSIPLDPSVITAEQQEADAFTAAGLLPAKVDISHFVDAEFNSTAAVH